MPSPATAQINRAATNRANSQHSTGPRTETGKQRSSLNALRHGLTARTAVLASEDLAAYQHHCRQFLDQHQPATPTETQLVQELADTSWRLNRIPILEADLLESRPVPSPKSPAPSTSPQASNAARTNGASSKTPPRSLNHKHKGIPWDPADHGFVFSKDQVELCSQRMMCQNEARYIAYARFDMPPRSLASLTQTSVAHASTMR